MVTDTQVVNAYLDWLVGSRRRSRNTAYHYRQTYEKLLAEGRPLSDATTDTLQTFLRRPRRTGRPAAPATIKRETMALRSLWKWMTTRGLASTDPTLLLLEECPAVHNEEPKPVSLRDWEHLWFGDLDVDERVAFGLGMFCGLRRAEIVSLRPDQFALDQGLVIGLQRKGGKPAKIRWATNIELYAARLPEWIGNPALFTEPLEKLVLDRADRPALLPWTDEMDPRRLTRAVHTPEPGSVNPDQMNKRLRKALVRNGMPKDAFSPHQLRHSFCTNLIDVGVPIQVVSKLAGHSSLQITMRYVDMGDDPLKSWVTAPPKEPPDELTTINRW